MVLITQAEAAYIRTECPTLYVVRTMKGHSKRHRYYVVEHPVPMAIIRRLRGYKKSSNCNCNEVYEKSE